MKLDGAVGILTGASRGIGAVLADRLAAAGVDLALAARSAEGLEQTAAAVKGRRRRALVVPTDVTARSDLEALVRTTVDVLGVPTLLVNNAGVERYCHFEDANLDDIERTVATNLTAAEILTRLVVPYMIAAGRGHIVNVASLAGKSAVPYNVVYSSTKHGLVGFSWGLRAEFVGRGIGATAVCPGFVRETGMYAAHRPGKAPSIAAEVSVDRVAAATIRAIERNLPDIVVGRGLARLSDVFHALSPRLAMAVARRGGAYRFLERIARVDEGRNVRL